VSECQAASTRTGVLAQHFETELRAHDGSL
jgi:hypothetical protein